MSMKSLLSQFEKEFKDKEFEHIVVDNHSEDGSEVKLKKTVEGKIGFHLIESNQNNGFGAGNNLGAKNAQGKYLLFLNNDTVVTTSSILDMITWMENHSDVAILGGALTNEDGSAQSSSGSFYTLGNALLLLFGLQRFGIIDKSPKKIQKVDFVKGACLMIRKSIFEKLKGFDEQIFMYTEDMELSYRAKKSGFLTYFFPNTGIIHKEHGSSSRSFAIVNIYQSLLYFYSKHRPRWEYILLRMLLMGKACILICIGKITGNSYLSQTYEKALAVC